MNFAIAAYAHSSGALATDPTLPLEDGELSTDGLVLAYARVIEVHGQSGKVDVVWPYMWLDGNALYAGEPVQRRVAGSGDPRLRLSVNLHGAPALELKDFATYQQGTIVGCSVQVSLPLGQYDDTRVVNLGANRWWVKPEIGVSHAVGSWTFEFAGGATFFGDNDDFLEGQVRAKEPIYSVQGGVIYGFPRGAWLAFHGTWYTGGRTSVDGVEGNDLQRNSLVGLTVGVADQSQGLSEAVCEQGGLDPHRLRRRHDQSCLATPMGRWPLTGAAIGRNTVSSSASDDSMCSDRRCTLGTLSAQATKPKYSPPA